MFKSSFGKQVKFVSDVLEAKRSPLDAGTDEDSAKLKVELAQQYSRVIMQIVVSIIVLCCSFWLLFEEGQSENMQKLASALLGTVLGYWLS